MAMRRAFKYRLYPNVNQTRELLATLETHRRIYNNALGERKDAWELEERSVTYRQQRKRYVDTYRENPFQSRLNANSAYETIRRVDRAFQAFFRRVKAKAGQARLSPISRTGSL